ncbi:hypothetical protein MH117_19145 [Paenibacillus sp. ACRRX]|uniref:hypothetical protein n=1 Tax=Paenibacillus sp. ACRRX TaxID=2918206 RepID=UPI001EF72658|nr:hypothetical protein [Paenibacillus sp. ACRRX]MCG7409528.1 hypothetical protein [Paenibacillus sp. ACRRX]
MKKFYWFLVVMAFVFMFDLWVENSDLASSFFHTYIEPYTDKAEFPIIWTILILAGVASYVLDILARKNEEKKELEATLHSEMQMLVMANQQLGAYRMRDILLLLFRSFVQNNPYVLAIQLYEFTLQHQKGDSVIKLNLMDGAIMENVDLNAVHQSYYRFSIQLYRDFVTARSAAERGDFMPFVDFVTTHNRSLSLKREQDLNEKDAIIYAFLLISFDLLEKLFEASFTLFLDPDKVKKLESMKRTGLLRAILLENYSYSFTHTGRNEKSNRQYIAARLRIQDKPYLYVIALDAEILHDANRNRLLDQITEDFENKLQKCLDSVYNGN